MRKLEGKPNNKENVKKNTPCNVGKPKNPGEKTYQITFINQWMMKSQALIMS